MDRGSKRMDDKTAAELLWQEFEAATQSLKDVLVERFLPLFPDLEQLFDMLPLADIASLLLKRKEEELLYFMQFGNFVPDALPPALHELGVSFKHYQSIQGSLFSCWGNRVRLVIGRTLSFVSR